MTENGYIDFRVNLGAWNDTHRANAGNDLSTLTEVHIIARATKGSDLVLAQALHAILDPKAFEEGMNEARAATDLGKALAALNSRKVKKAFTAASAGAGLQAKEEKMVQEMIRLHATRTLAREKGIELSYASPSDIKNGPSLTQGSIQFIANYPAWKCVKKFKVETETNRRTVAECMTSYMITLDLKYEAYLAQLFDLKNLESALAQAPGKGSSASDVLAYLASSPITNAIQTAAKKDPAAVRALTTYAHRKALKGIGAMVDYAQVKSLPGWKRVIGKRK